LAIPILKTKLYIPPPRPGIISRSRLLNQLDQGLKPGCPLILLSAPAGFGKTALLSDWTSRLKHRVAWLSLDEADNDALRFWRHLIAALQKIKFASDETMQLALEAVQAPPREVFIPSLLNDIAQVDEQGILVLEDYHLVDNVAIHHDINFLLNHLPSRFHMVITTRADPPLQIARRRAVMDLCEIRAGDLRFTREEIITFLNDTMKLGLSEDDIEALESRTEGWIVGLQMAALSMQGRDDKHAFITSFTGDDRYIADYLLEEVLQRQPIHIQTFLVRTSILNRLNASLCDTILEAGMVELKGSENLEQTGKTKPLQSSQEILEMLDRSNLFIVPLDNRREWYRYHHLFTSLLNQRLLHTQRLQEIQAIQKKASNWCETNGMLPEAVEYALAGEDYKNATRLISLAAGLMFERSEFNTVLLWADKLPVELLIKQPSLCVLFAWASLALGHPQQTELYLSLIEKSIGEKIETFLANHAAFDELPPLSRSALYDVGVIKARMAIDQFNTELTHDIARLVLPYLTLEQNKQPFLFNTPYNLRSPLLQTMALAYKIDGNLETARRHFTDALDLAVNQNNIHVITICMSEIGQILILQGNLREAKATFDKALRYSEELGERRSFSFNMSIVGLGILAYEWNDLDEANRDLHEGLKLARIWNNWEALLPGYLSLAQLMATQDNWDEAFTALQDLTDVLNKLAPIMLTIVEAYRAWLFTLQGNLEEAQTWVETAGLDPEGEIDKKLEAEYLILARVFYAQRKTNQALRLTTRLREMAEREESWGRAIQIMALQAILFDSNGLHEVATQTLLRALRLAAPQGYQRTFLDEGQVMENLVRRLESAEKETNELGDLSVYLQALLNVFEHEKIGVPAIRPGNERILKPSSTVNKTFVEPLSKRELEVLRLMADGASNTEIAQQLFLSVNTVKKHISNIFAKLGVATRIQAVDKGRRQGYVL
jgi:LuxR family maltose regulon positive regulatory protein